MIETSAQLDELVLLINQMSNEKQKRILLASAAKVYGHGGIGRIKELTRIADIVHEKTGYDISHEKVLQLLENMGYSKQVNQKMIQNGIPSPHRDEQFRFINDTAKNYMDASLPVISVDTKKKENVGNFKNNGSEYRKSKDPPESF